MLAANGDKRADLSLWSLSLLLLLSISVHSLATSSVCLARDTNNLALCFCFCFYLQRLKFDQAPQSIGRKSVQWIPLQVQRYQANIVVAERVACQPRNSVVCQIAVRVCLFGCLLLLSSGVGGGFSNSIRACFIRAFRFKILLFFLLLLFAFHYLQMTH